MRVLPKKSGDISLGIINTILVVWFKPADMDGCFGLFTKELWMIGIYSA